MLCGVRSCMKRSKTLMRREERLFYVGASRAKERLFCRVFPARAAASLLP